MWEFLQKLKQLQPESKNIVLTRLTGEALGEKALVSNGKLVWASVAGGFLEQHDQQIEQLEVNGIALVDGEKIFGEVVGGQKKIVICGGGHVSMPIIQLGRQIGCYVTVLEDRPKFADNARRAGADKVICDTFEAGLEQIPGDSDTFFVIVTRGHVYDRICLESIVRKPHAYIGMMGSRRRVAQVKQSVLENGADPQVISQLHSPIGLDIKAETPEEIAISIMAELEKIEAHGAENGWVAPMTAEDREFFAYFRSVFKRYNISPSKATRLEYDFVTRVAESEFYLQKVNA